MKLSLVCSLWATGLSVLFGVPLAYVLARAEFPGRALVRALVVLPMVLPPVVGGVALLDAFSVNNGLIGGWLVRHVRHPIHVQHVGRDPRGDVRRDAVPRHHRRSGPATDGPSLRGRRREPRRQSVDGLPPGHAPLIAPSLFAGAALAWARALGEFGATITFAGNIQGRTQTMPLAVYLLLETQQGTAIVLSLVLLAVSIIVLVALRDRWFGAVRES